MQLLMTKIRHTSCPLLRRRRKIISGSAGQSTQPHYLAYPPGRHIHATRRRRLETAYQHLPVPKCA